MCSIRVDICWLYLEMFQQLLVIERYIRCDVGWNFDILGEILDDFLGGILGAILGAIICGILDGISE